MMSGAMPPLDTTLGGSHKEFPETTWGMIARMEDSDSPEFQNALETLIRRYWKPIYLYIRAGFRKSNEDAKDLTQTFFLWAMEKNIWSRYRTSLGSFRGYLKALLKNFLVDHERALQCLKRGGNVTFVEFDESSLPTEPRTAPAAPAELDRIFDDAWASEILERAVRAVRTLFTNTGRADQFRCYREYDQAPEDRRPTYAELAERMGVKEATVRNHLFAVREALRKEIQAELALLTRGERELAEEWRVLFES